MKAFKESILCAGHGGQGIVSMGKLLAYAGMQAGYQVTFFPSYGAEVRGGTAHSMVRIQYPEAIANPVITHPTVAIIMNKPSLDKFLGRIAPGGVLLYDAAAAEKIPEKTGVTIKKIPCTAIALKLKDKRVANMAALGSLSKIKGLFSLQELIQCLPFIFSGKQDLIEKNTEALRQGFNEV
ncbi:MAG: 2-oxoacid:acceptor oxidoreductase family protein [Candidatus Omnitrophica bacterium]|nr:2-oxoacid:acceptor oxidoreductase family protein [Candidatus Omnitrophota bacterium]